MFRTLVVLFTVAALVLGGGLALAQAAQGTHSCSLYYATRLQGGEITSTNISLRNLGAKGTMTIERIDIYQSDGTLATSLTPGKFPSGFRSSLGPHQYTSLRLVDVIKTPPPGPGLQADVSWSADAPTVFPLVTSVFLTFGRDPKTGAEKKSRARHVLPCASVSR
ncbi:MAG: hypothetical protein ACREJ4_08980 [Candidatus Methylomirabilaceae bacterium]